MSIARALSILGAGLGGYGQGQEQNRQRQRQAEDDEFRKLQRERTKMSWQREDAKYEEEEAQRQADMAAAVAPVPKAAAIRPETMDNRDVGQPGEQSFDINVGGQTVPNQAAADAVVQQAMTPQARMARVAAVQRDPVRAAQIQQQAGSIEAQQGQLEAMRRQQAVQAFDDGIRKAAGTWDGLTTFLNESKADGADGAIKFGVKREGGKVTLFPVGPNGQPAGQGSTFTDDEQGRAQAAFLFSQGTTPEMKLRHLREEANAASVRQDREADNARQDARFKADDQYRQQALAMQRAGMAARASSGGPAQGGPIWDNQADTFLRQRYTVADPVTGQVQVDGAGLQFAKQIGLAQSMRNGGDTTSALGYAFEIDNRIKQQAGNDPTKIAQMRQQLLQSLMGQGQQPAAQSQQPAQRQLRPDGPTLAGVNSAARQPGRMAQIASAARGMLDRTSAEGAAYEMMDARFREAGQGGPPLTPEEIAAGRRFGLVATN